MPINNFGGIIRALVCSTLYTVTSFPHEDCHRRAMRCALHAAVSEDLGCGVFPFFTAV